MIISNTPRLCGGIFFTLLLQAKKQRIKVRSTYSGDSDGLSDTEMLKALIRIMDPNYSDPPISTFKNNTSKYKACGVAKGTYLPFDDDSTIKAFDCKVEKHYTDVLLAMTNFINTFIDIQNEAKCTQLVKALLELITTDTTIGVSESFYISSDGQCISKTEVCNLSNICLNAFLLGIWHYIVVNRPDNLIGKDTYETWHNPPDTKGQQRKFISAIGAGIDRVLHITILDPEEIKVDTEDADIKTEFIEAEIIDEDFSKTKDGTAETTAQTVTIIKHQTNVVQYGEKSISLVNNGTLHIDL